MRSLAPVASTVTSHGGCRRCMQRQGPCFWDTNVEGHRFVSEVLAGSTNRPVIRYGHPVHTEVEACHTGFKSFIFVGGVMPIGPSVHSSMILIVGNWIWAVQVSKDKQILANKKENCWFSLAAWRPCNIVPFCRTRMQDRHVFANPRSLTAAEYIYCTAAKTGDCKSTRMEGRLLV